MIQSLWSFRGGGFAGIGREIGVVVQLRGSGGAGSQGPSAATDPGVGGRGARGDGERVCRDVFGGLGRPSIAPEKLLRAMLLQAFYSIRSERQLMERLEFDLLFRWFVGLGIDDVVWDHSTFSKNRDRLLDGDVAARFLAVVLAQPRVKRLLSSDHFSVDGTLIEAWASMKSVKPKEASSGGSDLSHRPPNDWWPQRRSGLQGREAFQRNTCLDHGSRCAALSQGAGYGDTPRLYWATRSWRTARACWSTRV